MLLSPFIIVMVCSTIKNENNRTKKRIYLNYTMLVNKEQEKKNSQLLFNVLLIITEKKRQKKQTIGVDKKFKQLINFHF